VNPRLSAALDSLFPVSGRWRRYLLIVALAGTVAWTCQISTTVARLAAADLGAAIAAAPLTQTSLPPVEPRVPLKLDFAASGHRSRSDVTVRLRLTNTSRHRVGVLLPSNRSTWAEASDDRGRRITLAQAYSSADLVELAPGRSISRTVAWSSRYAPLPPSVPKLKLRFVYCSVPGRRLAFALGRHLWLGEVRSNVITLKTSRSRLRLLTP
jgi:hypothetical protein